MPVTWSDEKLILLYCPGRGSNSRRSAQRGFKHGQGVPRPYSLGHGGGYSGDTCTTLNSPGTVEDSRDPVTIRDTTGSSALIDSFRSHDGAGSKSQCFDAAFTMTLLTASADGTEKWRNSQGHL